MTFIATAQVPTPSAARYIGRLCKHFQHKLPVEFDQQQGRIEFPFGLCLLSASAEHLDLQVQAGQAEERQRLEEVVGSHFARFAWQAELNLEWVVAQE
ncbi:MAG: DUF2218 domain-containing protein [Pseudomonas sp.]|uniref:DUF2218 domain-containing protein n=1 Tax=Pseudomonas sp. TaxID=306 RepID=UPI0033996679